MRGAPDTSPTAPVRTPAHDCCSKCKGCRRAVVLTCETESNTLATLLGIPIRLLGIFAGLSLASNFIGTMVRSLRRLAELEPPGVKRE